ncbi:hypothetical protein AMJ57_03895 [Parcubacteria bacterium SG8_24]|nr:MAG: hypothetical protein AMJ57_03895 [Parcubacteria bacterium SG8_24]
MNDTKKELPKGGSFLIEDATPEQTLVPEDFTEELLAMKEAAEDFMKGEVTPQAARLEEHDLELLKSLVRQAGELGLLSVDIDDEYGGLGLGLAVGALIIEAIGSGGSGSYATTVGAHNGIGLWPILYFGNDEQKARYLPGIASGELVAAYALTEPSSGSDALSGKCKATLSEDSQHWIVNGEKTFITNAGIADVFTVLVKIDGDDKQTACLIVDRDTPGLIIGPEEHKMGIRGSSTCSMIFDDAEVPVGNLLGEIGKGHRIVLNTLNLGRFKLGAGAVGGLKTAVTEAAQYAAERQQFGRPLVKYDAIKAKLADMTVDTWVGESMVYRTAGLLHQSLEKAPDGDGRLGAIKEYTVECAMVKVALSEMLDRAVDEAVQIHGGYGFIEEYAVARAYRDSRVNRIFEGTNEINRMLTVGDLLKKAMKGLDLMGAANNIDEPKESATPLRAALDGAKKATLYVLSQAALKHMMALPKEQQILMELADMLIGVYAMESALLRLEKLAPEARSHTNAPAIVGTFFDRTLWRLRQAATVVLTSLHEGAEALEACGKANNHLIQAPADVIGLRRDIAAAVITANKYPF